MPTRIVADAVPCRHIPPSDTPSGAITGDAVDLIAAIWQPRFPSREMIAQAADLLPRVHRAAQDELAEGPRPFIRIGPGVIEVRSKDFARADRAAEREIDRREIDVELLAAYYAENGDMPAAPDPTRVITEWSRKSRSNMIRTLGLLDFTPMYEDRTRMPGMVTLTYPGDWVTVAPSGKAVKAHLKAFRKRYERAWAEPLRCVWKLEFQRRGAPHIHMLMVPPHGQVDGINFREWLSRAWADVVAHPDQDEYQRHLAAGTGVDFAEGLRASDPKRIGVYFSKHSTFKAKEYQHNVPEEWSTPETGPGRFWGYWGLERGSEVVEVGQLDGTVAGRTLRRWAAAQQTTKEVTRPRVKHGRVIPKYATVEGLAGAYLVESRPEPKYRTTRIRAGRMRGNRGYVMVNDGAVMGAQLARYLAMAADERLDSVDTELIVSTEDHGSLTSGRQDVCMGVDHTRLTAEGDRSG